MISSEEFDRRMKELAQCSEANPTLVKSAEKIIRTLLKSKVIPYPFIYLNFDGGIQIEWDVRNWDISVSFKSDMICGDATNVKTYKTDDFEANWDISADVLSEIVNNFFKMAESDLDDQALTDQSSDDIHNP